MQTSHRTTSATHPGRDRRKTPSRPMTQLPAGPDYWPVPAQASVRRRAAGKPRPAEDRTPEPAA
jgi:hypothetical protein